MPLTSQGFRSSYDNKVVALMARLAPKAKVLRDGKWIEEHASVLVPGDIISIKLGDIIPADACLLDGNPQKINQSALTGESFSLTKHVGEGVYSGSTIMQGETEAVVTATGVSVFFGKATHLVETSTHVGHYQQAHSLRNKQSACLTHWWNPNCNANSCVIYHVHGCFDTSHCFGFYTQASTGDGHWILKLRMQQ